MIRVYVVHGFSGSIYGVLTDYTRAEACQALAQKQEESRLLPWDDVPEQLAFLSEEILNEPRLGGC